jgi:hypothetical protein
LQASHLCLYIALLLNLIFKLDIMKKIYLLAVFALGLGLSANAQFEDDLEVYSTGPLFTPRWTTWSGENTGNENVIISEDQAFDGTKSVFIDNVGGGQDAILDIGGLKTAGVWSLAWKMYIPAGSTGYFNIQGNVTPNANDNQEFYTGNITLVAGTMSDDGGSTDLVYPEDQWFDFSIELDVDASTYELKLNSSTGGVQTKGASATGFGGADFYADNSTNNYYVDAVRFAEGVLGADDFSGDVFSVFPNPVVNTLNIKSAIAVDNVTIYDVLGKQVLSVNPDAISPSVDMSALSSGAYLVNVTIGNASKTIKVLK